MALNPDPMPVTAQWREEVLRRAAKRQAVLGCVSPEWVVAISASPRKLTNLVYSFSSVGNHSMNLRGGISENLRLVDEESFIVSDAVPLSVFKMTTDERLWYHQPKPREHNCHLYASASIRVRREYVCTQIDPFAKLPYCPLQQRAWGEMSARRGHSLM